MTASQTLFQWSSLSKWWKIRGNVRTDKYDRIWIDATSCNSDQHDPTMIEKMAIYETEIAADQIVAGRYGTVASDKSAAQKTMAACRSACARQKVDLGAASRHYTIEELNTESVPTAVYYPQPLDQKTCYSKFSIADKALVICECFFDELLSVLLHPHLKEVTENYNFEAVRDTIAAVFRAECCG